MLSKSWKYFLKCAELGSFSRAAAHFKVGQSTISASILKLEEENGFPLIERGPGLKKLKLTEKGRSLFQEVSTMQEHFAIVHQGINKLKPTLRIGCVQHVAIKYLLPILDHQAFNPYAVQLYSVPRFSHLELGILEGKYDLTIASTPQSFAGFSENVIADELIYFIALKANHPEISKCKSMEEMLKRTNLHERAPFQKQWSDLIEEGVAGYFVDDHLSAKALIMQGYGISPYPLDYFSLSELKALAISPAPTPFQDWKIKALYRDLKLTPEKRKIVDYAIKQLKNSMQKAHRQIKPLLPKI